MARLDDLMARSSDDQPAVDLHADDPSTLLYTSGTTGNPKGVVFTHGRTGTSGAQFIEALHLTPDDTILAVTPLFHGNAWGAVVTALHAGSTVAFPEGVPCLRVLAAGARGEGDRPLHVGHGPGDAADP